MYFVPYLLWPPCAFLWKHAELGHSHLHVQLTIPDSIKYRTLCQVTNDGLNLSSLHPIGFCSCQTDWTTPDITEILFCFCCRNWRIYAIHGVLEGAYYWMTGLTHSMIRGMFKLTNNGKCLEIFSSSFSFTWDVYLCLNNFYTPEHMICYCCCIRSRICKSAISWLQSRVAVIIWEKEGPIWDKLV